MNCLVKNRYFDALLKLMLFSAIIHMGILILYSVINLNIEKLNFFDILRHEDIAHLASYR